MSFTNNESFLSLLISRKPVRLSYVAENDIVYLISTDFESRWPSHILREKVAAMDIKGSRVVGMPVLITKESEKKSVIQKFTLKYGETYVVKYFSHPSRMIRIEPGRMVTDISDKYYTWLEEEFDSVADDYDNHIFGNMINVLLRNRSLAVLRRHLSKNSRILEIGCGTGAETLELLKDGHHVLAIDISGRMLDNLNRKAEREGVSANLRTRKLKASMLGEILREEGEESFDLVYSTYGALNCEPNLMDMVEPLSVILKPGGYFVAGVYNKYCISEAILHIASLKLNRIFWRMRSPIPEGRSRFCIDVYSFTPSEFFEIFSTHFSREEIIGVPVIFPPSNYKKLFSFFSRKYDQLDRLDKKLSHAWPTKFLGDHFLMVLSNRP